MYDYIIVGAGSAGCVLANRLTEDPSVNVLLIEAGGSDNKLTIRIPAAFIKLFKTPVDWAFDTEPQPHLANRRLYWPRGKVLGGSSSINVMIYIRGNRLDYDQWRDLGNEGWGFADVLPYFKKAENQERGASTYHGVGGPLNVADLRLINPLTKAFVEAGQQIRLKFNADFNGASQEGVGYFQATQKNGQRHSTAAAYLRPALARSNLTVLTDAMVTRILFQKNTVTGIDYIQNGKEQQVLASREVILCGGAINSPQLLLLSGIGPADELHALGIPVVLDLPGVGQNLQDHLGVPIAYNSTAPITLDKAENFRNLLNFLLFRQGPLTSIIAEGCAFVQTMPNLTVPNLQMYFGAAFFLNHGLTKVDGYGFSLGPTLLTPKSRGQITLRSADPLAAPVIQPNYLSEEFDRQTMLDGVQLARQLAAANAFDPYRGTERYPGVAAQSQSAIEEHISAHADTLYHPVGTCKMGSDPLAVVDSQLRVHGIQGLRVVDASIMPMLVAGNTNAPVIMIAEKAADLIKETQPILIEADVLARP